AHRGTGVRRVDDLTVAGVDADMACAAVEGDDVARLQVGLRDLRPATDLRLAGARDGDPGLLVGPRGEAGAVERVRSGGAPDVGRTDARRCGVENLLTGGDLGRGGGELLNRGDRLLEARRKGDALGQVDGDLRGHPRELELD